MRHDEIWSMMLNATYAHVGQAPTNTIIIHVIFFVANKTQGLNGYETIRREDGQLISGKLDTVTKTHIHTQHVESNRSMRIIIIKEMKWISQLSKWYPFIRFSVSLYAMDQSTTENSIYGMHVSAWVLGQIVEFMSQNIMIEFWYGQLKCENFMVPKSKTLRAVTIWNL